MIKQYLAIETYKIVRIHLKSTSFKRKSWNFDFTQNVCVCVCLCDVTWLSSKGVLTNKEQLQFYQNFW